MHSRPVPDAVQPSHTCFALCISMRHICKRTAAVAHPASLHRREQVCSFSTSRQLQQHPTHAELLDRLRAEKLPWTDLMDRAMAAAHEARGATAADVQAACAKVPMHPRMQEASESFVTSVLSPPAACMYCRCCMLSRPCAFVYARNNDLAWVHARAGRNLPCDHSLVCRRLFPCPYDRCIVAVCLYTTCAHCWLLALIIIVDLYVMLC